MKLQLSLLLLVFSIPLVAQVGINNTDPQETLHVNGTVRIETTDQATVTTDKLFGLDSNGTLREIAVGTNLILDDNTLYAKSGFDHAFGSVSFVLEDQHNVDLLLDPGEANFGKSIIRIINTDPDTTITGISGGYDGQHIWIYAQAGKVTLSPNDILSLVGNRIEINDKLGAKAWGMIELVYDGTKGKWIVMIHHQ
jgi:hypothetical protein